MALASVIGTGLKRIQPVCCDELMWMSEWHPTDTRQRWFKCKKCGATKSVQQCTDEAKVMPRH